ncbi:MAG: phosphatase PAP2 family protein [Myxococcaceae bacterium]
MLLAGFIGVALAASSPTAEPVSPRQSVYRVSWWGDSAVAVGTSAFGLTAYLLQDEIIHPRCPCDVSEVPQFDRGAIGNQNQEVDRWAQYLSIAGLVPPMVIDFFDVGFGVAFAEDLVVFGEAMGVSFALTTLLKFTTQRPIPRVYAGQDPLALVTPGGYRAFYSGHVAMAATALTVGAMTWTYRHGPTAWPWILDGAVGLALSVGVIVSGGHFLSDVVVGVIAGAGIGVAVPLLHRRTGFSGQTLTLVPSQNGAAVAWIGVF